MVKAVEAVRKGVMGWKKAVKEFNVPRSTLKRYVRNVTKSPQQVVQTCRGRKPILSAVLEQELVSYLLELEASFFGFTTSDMRRMAYQLALRNDRRHSFNVMKETAGRKWKDLFLRRHPELSLRKATGTSTARIVGFRKEAVS